MLSILDDFLGTLKAYKCILVYMLKRDSLYNLKVQNGCKENKYSVIHNNIFQALHRFISLELLPFFR